MSCTGFKNILGYVHRVDYTMIEIDSTMLDYNKINKVGWFIERFIQKSQGLYNPKCIITIDKIMILYKDRY